MENIVEFEESWTEVGKRIANGGQLTISEVRAIADNLELEKMDPKFLPGESTVIGKDPARKYFTFYQVECLWSINPNEWLEKEKNWLNESRQLYPSNATEGKDSLDDVISAEIILRIVATAKIVKTFTDPEIVNEAVFALNLILSDACAKGRMRLKKFDGKSVYGVLRNNGLRIGSVGGKYLPLPEKSMPELLLLLHKDYIYPGAYLS